MNFSGALHFVNFKSYLQTIALLKNNLALGRPELSQHAFEIFSVK